MKACRLPCSFVFVWQLLSSLPAVCLLSVTILNPLPDSSWINHKACLARKLAWLIVEIQEVCVSPSLCLQLTGICWDVRHHNHSLWDDCTLCVITYKTEEELLQQVAGNYALNELLIFRVFPTMWYTTFSITNCFGVLIYVIAPLSLYLLHSNLYPHPPHPMLELSDAAESL